MASWMAWIGGRKVSLVILKNPFDHDHSCCTNLLPIYNQVGTHTNTNNKNIKSHKLSITNNLIVNGQYPFVGPRPAGS